MFAKRHYEFLAAWLASATICTTDPQSARSIRVKPRG